MSYSRFINRKPASNFHHAIRIAEAIRRPLNTFVSFNFGFTACPPEKTPRAFQLLRRKFGKWITRPPATIIHEHALATFVWVIERPLDSNHFNSHWLVHVPKNRQQEFAEKLPVWLASVAGGITDTIAAIHVQNAQTPRGLGKYMLKGEHPWWAAQFDIRHEPQGWIEGRRSGFTKNIGPTQKRRLIAIGQYAKPRRYVSFRAA